jgi:hypothetical protein
MYSLNLLLAFADKDDILAKNVIFSRTRTRAERAECARKRASASMGKA